VSVAGQQRSSFSPGEKAARPQKAPDDIVILLNRIATPRITTLPLISIPASEV